MKTLSLLFVSVCVALTVTADPALTGDVTIQQDPVTRKVTIGYQLDTAGGAGIVTFDIQTNTPSGYVSIGGEHLATASGDVNRKVTPKTGLQIRWQPDNAAFDTISDDLRAVVKVWPTNSPPPYFVIDLSGRKNHRFYPDVGQIPLGVTNDVYKVDFLVMRRIPAAGVTWRMGAGEGETALAFTSSRHLVTLPDDYYLGIYPVTLGQLMRVGLNFFSTSAFGTCADAKLRPADNLTYTNIRNSDKWPTNGHTQGQYSYFNYFRSKAGNLAFDIPTEAEWEYACRAGTRTERYRTDLSDDALGWYSANAGNETHPVGTRAPNPWGLYDFYGNVREWTLDYFKEDYGINDSDFDSVRYWGPTSCDNKDTHPVRVIRGTSFTATSLGSSATRSWGSQYVQSNEIGFRVALPVVYPL